MGWVRFLLAAAALPALVAGFWLVFVWQGQPTNSEAMPVLTTQSPSACEYFQSVSVDRARVASRDLDRAPDFAFAAASEAMMSAELARQICDPVEWADPKILDHPLALQVSAYRVLSEGSISVLESACEHLSSGVLAEEAFQQVLEDTAQSEFALRLSQSARQYVCAGASAQGERDT